MLTASVAAVDLDVTAEDIDRALSIARLSARERAGFHAPYVKAINTPFVESVDIVTEYRRVVLMAEERARRGDRMFGYSVSLATQALSPWKRRLALVARMRFHPHNNYIGVPAVDVSVAGYERALIGVLKEPVLSLPSAAGSEHLTVIGAVVEGVFDAEAVGQGLRDFVIRLDGREVALVRFDLSVID